MAFLVEPGSSNIGAVMLVDLHGKVSTLTDGWLYARDLAWRPDGEEVWFSAARSGLDHAIHAVTLGGRERLVRGEAGQITVADIAKDGRVLTIAYTFAGGMVARGPEDREERDVSWLDYTWLAALSADGRTILFDEIGNGGGRNGALYLRRMSEPAAVRLGEGGGLALSPDGQWALATAAGDATRLVLVPTGPGQPRPLGKSDIDVSWAEFLPGGTAILAKGNRPGRPARLYLRELSSQEWKPMSPEGLGTGPIAISNDGRLAATSGPDSKILLCPLDGGASRPVTGSLEGEVPVAWSADGRALYVYKRTAVPAPVYRLEIETGRRELWKEISPADRNGVYRVDRITVSNDGRAYAYSYSRRLGRLFVAEGLR